MPADYTTPQRSPKGTRDEAVAYDPPVPLTAVVLAAGQGTRMRSKTPKVLHDLCGRPLVRWPVEAALAAGAEKVVVVGGPDRALEGHLPDGVDARGAARGERDGRRGPARGGAHRRATTPSSCSTATSRSSPPRRSQALADARTRRPAPRRRWRRWSSTTRRGYGRVVRDDARATSSASSRRRTPGDATPEELAIREVNTGIYAFDGGPLTDALAQLTTDNAQGEYYLPDVLPVLRADGRRVVAHVVDDPCAGARRQRPRAARARSARSPSGGSSTRHLRAGVTFVDPAATTVDVGVDDRRRHDDRAGLRPARRDARSARAARIGPNTTLIDARVGDGSVVLHAYSIEADVDDGVTVGPFAYLRPGTRLRDGAKIGTFVEVKNSDIGEGTKVPHLSYLGDADVGAGHEPRRRPTSPRTTTAATSTARRSARTCKTSVDTTFVAPVTVGDDAWTAAGSVITEDVPDGALGVARARQTNVEGYARRKG